MAKLKNLNLKHRLLKQLDKKIDEYRYKKSENIKYMYTRDTALYRETPYNTVNKKLVAEAKRGNNMYFVKHLLQQDLYNTKLDFDEIYQNRYGLELILNEISKMPQNIKILDAGCGNCSLLKEIKNAGYENLSGVDLSPSRVINNRKYIKNLYFGFCEEMPIADESQDVVILTEVLEHVCDLKKALSEVRRVLKPNGKVFFQVPYKNMVDCTNHLRLFSKETFSFWTGQYFKIDNLQIIPYLKGQEPCNLFLIGTKTNNYKVEFYLIDSFEIYHFLPIYEELIKRGKDACFVCEPPEINTLHKWFDYDNAIDILNKLGVKYTTVANPFAQIAFTTQHAKVLSKYYGKKFNLNYGCGFNKTNFGNMPESTKGFDGKLVHGEFMAKNAKQFLNADAIYTVGYPKHDTFFKNKIQKNELLKKLNIKTDKPILVYFPTWDDDSSILKFSKEINELKQDFFVVTKAHHCTFRLPEKKNDLDLLYKISDVVLEGNSNFAEAVTIADIGIIDAKSGSSCEVPYLKPCLPIVFLSPRENLKKYFINDIFEFGYFINNPENLIQTVNECFQNDKYIEHRKNRIEYYMGKNDALSTKRAVDAILSNIKF